MENKDVDKKMLDMLKFDDAGQVPDSVPAPGDVLLPKIVSDKIKEELMEMNVIRRIFPKVIVPRGVRNLTIPAITHEATTNVHLVTYGTDVGTKTESQFATKSVVLTPKLLVAYTDIIEDDLETAGMDLARTVRENLTKNLGKAEEEAELYGDTTGGTGTYLDAFDGVYTVAAGATNATADTTYVGATDKLSLKIMEAKQAMSVYGRDASNMVVLVSTAFGLAMRKEDLVYSQQYRVDTNVLKSGTLPPVAGMIVIETSYLDAAANAAGYPRDEVAIIVRKDAFVVGERKNVHFRTDDIVSKFSKRIIIAEELDVQPQLKNKVNKFEGIALIYPTA